MDTLIEKTNIVLDEEEILVKEKVANCINIDYLGCSYKDGGVLSCDFCGWYEAS